jgi:hypothetical protein
LFSTVTLKCDKKKWKSEDGMIRECVKIVMYGRVIRLSFGINMHTTYFRNLGIELEVFLWKIFNINMKIILQNHNTTDSVGQWIFWIWVGFCPKPNFIYGFFVLKSIQNQ